LRKLIIFLSIAVLVLSAGCFPAAGARPQPLTAPTLTPDSRLVAIFFDDAYQNQYEAALPVLVKYGFRVTFGVITESIGEGEGLWKYMGKKELKELAGYGMEIASHTISHPHITEKLSDQQLRREIFDSKRDLEKMGFTVSTLIYPYYEYKEKAIEYVREAGYVCARAGWPEIEAFDLTSGEPDAWFRVPSEQIFSQDLAGFQKIVDKASRYKVVCLVYHLISDTGPEMTSTTAADFNAQMYYLHENGFTVVLLSELLKQ
jgi:peptidoglycan/xylan/chitin deacetylase (PgdA/CDA1 family)